MNGKLVVAGLLVLGLLGGVVLSHFMPRENPKATVPGSPYYSPPTTEELKAAETKQ